MVYISVIVPIYNTEQYLEKCIESILSQTIIDIEVILINDGSLDRSKEICIKFSETDNRVKFIDIPNGGVSNARNLGIKHATGENILFVDSDDYINETLAENLCSSMQTNKSDFSMCGYYRVGDNYKGGQSKTLFHCARYNGSIDRFLNNIIDYFYPPIIQSACWKLFRKEIIVENKIMFNEKMDFGEDTDFVLTYLKYCSTVSCVEAPLYYYRAHGTKTLSSKFNINKMNVYVYLANKVDKLGQLKLIENKNHRDIIICNSFISFIREITSTQKSLCYSQIIDIIRATIMDQEIRSSFDNLKKISIRYYFIYILLKVKFPPFIFLVFKLKTQLFRRKR